MEDDPDDVNDGETTDPDANPGGSRTTVHHTWEQTQPSVAIVEAVAAATGRPETDLPPLREVIDPDALDTLLARASSVEISFAYAGVAITASGDGTIEIR